MSITTKNASNEAPKTPVETAEEIKKHIDLTNSAISSAVRAQGKIFQRVYAAYEALGSSASAWKQYRKGVKADRSMINKVIKIANSEFVRENIEKLPLNFATLYSVAMMTGSAENAPNHSVELMDAIEKGKIGITSTLKEVKAVVGEETEKKETGSSNLVRYDLATIAEEQQPMLEEALELLRSIGFEVKEVSKVSELPTAKTAKKSVRAANAVSVKEAA